jgi:drug/metabolite transporter (DMT)-like permease
MRPSFKAPDVMRGLLALLLIGAFELALFWLFQFEVPQTNRDLVVFMLGQLSGFTGAAVAYYLGTSKSSSDKDKHLFLPPSSPATAQQEFEPDPLDPSAAETRRRPFDL